MDMNKTPAIEPHFAPLKSAPDALFVSALVSSSESEDGDKAKVPLFLVLPLVDAEEWDFAEFGPKRSGGNNTLSTE